MRPLQAIKIIKIGSVEKPYDPYSDFGDRVPFHLGVWLGPPVVGQRFEAGPYSSKPNERGISSSPVTKIIDENTFETLNSVYKIEAL